jgi:8-oxo-dGTP diphosphatase
MAHKNQSELIARGFILHQSHVLMCRNTKSNFYYLPGGHIEFAEPAASALKRELQEEASADISVGPLLLTTENSFNDGKQDHHEINLVFHVEQLNGVKLAAAEVSTNSTSSGDLRPEIVSQEDGIDFDWIDLAAVADIDIRPLQIKAWLASGGALTANQTIKSPSAESISGLAAAPHLASFEIDYVIPASH